MRRGSRTVARWVWMEGIRRKDAYVLLVLLGALLLFLSLYDPPVNASPVRYVLETGLLLTWLFSFVLTVTLAGRQLPADLSSGMVLAVLSKPLNRKGWLIGKWAGSWGMVSTATLIFYAAVAGIGLLQGGLESFEVWAQAMLLHVAALSVVTVFAIALSTRLTAGATVSIGLLVALACWTLLPVIGRQAAETGGVGGSAFQVLYYSLPHLELLDLRRRVVHAWGPAPWRMVVAALVYAGAWTFLGLLLAWLGFRRRSLGRGDT